MNPQLTNVPNFHQQIPPYYLKHLNTFDGDTDAFETITRTFSHSHEIQIEAYSVPVFSDICYSVAVVFLSAPLPQASLIKYQPQGIHIVPV